MSYNGWSNYETWYMNLHFFDGMSPKECGLDVSGDMIDDVSNLAEIMKEMVGGLFDNVEESNLVTAMARSFESNVNYREIARNKLLDYAKEKD